LERKFIQIKRRAKGLSPVEMQAAGGLQFTNMWIYEAETRI